MTLGIDVSRLFTEMMLAIETRDLVVKKMVYLYLCTYARQKPDLAIMCINTLQRDWYVNNVVNYVPSTQPLLPQPSALRRRLLPHCIHARTAMVGR